MPFVETPFGSIFYIVRGTGSRIVLCIHGAGGTHQLWGYQLRGLSVIAQVIALDLPGHGRSKGKSCSTIANYSQVIASTLDALGQNQVILVGHSMGGAIALWVTLTMPERVKGLALVGSAARLRVLPAFMEGMLHNPQETLEQITAHFYGTATPAKVRVVADAVIRWTDPMILYNDFQACDTFDVRDRLGQITCPTLIVCGAEDQMTPLKYSHSLHNGIIGSKLVSVQEAGHMVMIEQPDNVTVALREFIAQVSGPTTYGEA